MKEQASVKTDLEMAVSLSLSIYIRIFFLTVLESLSIVYGLGLI